jgi:hypothetical protein
MIRYRILRQNQWNNKFSSFSSKMIKFRNFDKKSKNDHLEWSCINENSCNLSVKRRVTQKKCSMDCGSTAADLFENSKIKDDELFPMMLSCMEEAVFATGILGLKRIKKLLPSLAGKKIAVFGVGLSPVREDTINSVKQHNLTEEELKAIHFYYCSRRF